MSVFGSSVACRAATVNVCWPSPTAVTKGDAQGNAAPPSSEQSKPFAGRLAPNPNVASPELVVSAGPEVINVSGCGNAMSSTTSRPPPPPSVPVCVSKLPVKRRTERICGPPGCAWTNTAWPNVPVPSISWAVSIGLAPGSPAKACM